MQENSSIDRRRELQTLPSEKLSALIHSETGKEIPDDDLVLTALHILEDREPDQPEALTPREEAAWEKYRAVVRARKRRPRVSWRGAAKAASMVLVLGLLMTSFLPQEAEAENLWDRFTKLTNSFFAFFQSEKDSFSLDTYVFQTENPGLQQVYDAVVEMGVTEPVVPMWLPDGYELVECKSMNTPVKRYVHARFSDGEKEFVFQVHVLFAGEPNKYPKDDANVTVIEKNGISYNCVKNDETWNVASSRGNIECAFTMDCQEEILNDVILSIYRWRKNE